MASSSAVHIFGVRHHGPGSARSVRAALGALKPDIVLIEGPPDADGLIPLVADEGMKPPVAILIYDPAQPSRSVYYPFAEFSPEWQGMRHALQAQIPVRFIDLPMTHQFAIEDQERKAAEAQATTADRNRVDAGADADAGSDSDAGADSNPSSNDGSPETETAESLHAFRRDPLGWLAEAAGYDDGERWWEHVVEHRRDSADQFLAIREAMSAVREHMPKLDDVREERREAHMRREIRRAQAQGHQRIAVICGAYHSPALMEMPPAETDDAVLKGLPKSPVNATWIPWTYSRLSAESGYGAGIESPGWYDHLWTHQDRIVERWMTKTAWLFREQELDASAAHVIEAVRLAETLAALRGRALPGLNELNEAIQAIFCFGDDLPMRLIRDRLIVSDRLGSAPDETPMVPLQSDLNQQRRELKVREEDLARLKNDDWLRWKRITLDLREATDLKRSQLWHRLSLLGVPWANEEGSSGKGTFKEIWKLDWQPEFAVKLIEAGSYGNTIAEAARGKVRDQAAKAQGLPELTKLLYQAFWADLPDTVAETMSKVEAMAAVSSDVIEMMEALPDLAYLQRRGDVRKTDVGMVGKAVDGMVARVCVNLPNACSSLDDDAAEKMFDLIVSMSRNVIDLLRIDDHTASWRQAIRRIADRSGIHHLVAGRCFRILFNAGELSSEEVADRISFVLSLTGDPAQGAEWLRGFLKDSGELLVHDDLLFGVIDGWVGSLKGETFQSLVPLLRRTFSSFSTPVRRSIGERAKHGVGASANVKALASRSSAMALDQERADAVLPLAAKLLGVPWPAASPQTAG